MRNILELALLRLKRLDIVARSPEVRQGGQGVFALHFLISHHPSLISTITVQQLLFLPHGTSVHKRAERPRLPALFRG